MTRFLANSLLLTVAGLASVPLLRAQDAVWYLDRTMMKEVVLTTGSIIEESPAQVVYKLASGGSKEIAATDLVDITYEVPGSVRLAYRSALADERKTLDPSLKEEERKKAYQEALKSYQEVLANLAATRSKFVERHVRYKIARLRARQALDDPSQLDAAIVALLKFKSDYPDGWQINPAARLAAQLQVDKGDFEGARKTYEELAATPHIAREIQQDCAWRIIDLLIQAKKCAAAQIRLQMVLKNLPASDPQAARARVYQAECAGASGQLPEAIAQIERIIAKTTDKDLKALAYNALGDCYRLNGRPTEALWPYLWVDVIYHQDRQEHAKALAELAKLFAEQGDTARAQEYKDRLKRTLDF
jgi:tetratricopeptide (TPR) repeat protein